MFTAFESPGVRGFLHEPAEATGIGLVLTHGAGANCRSAVLTLLAEAFASEGWRVLRCDMAFRQAKSAGPPHPAHSARDRESLRAAVEALHGVVKGPIVLGGHSYGGRQASMLLAEDPDVAVALLLLSYPLHPPKQPEKARTAHFPGLLTPALFVHGSGDPFASITELEAALRLIPARHALSVVAGAGHDLGRGKLDVRRQVVLPLQAILKG